MHGSLRSDRCLETAEAGVIVLCRFRGRPSATRHGREERDLVPFAEGAIGRGILEVHGGGRHDAKRREMRNFGAKDAPQIRDRGTVGETARLLRTAGVLSERGEIEESDPHEGSLVPGPALTFDRPVS
jgi:hypothetical protein